MAGMGVGEANDIQARFVPINTSLCDDQLARCCAYSSHHKFQSAMYRKIITVSARIEDKTCIGAPHVISTRASFYAG